MKTKRAAFALMLTSTSLFISSAVFAAPTCTFANTVILNSMSVTATGASVFANAGFQATSCYGVTSGNNVTTNPQGSDNQGVIDTSILNGGSAGQNTYFDPYYLPGVQSNDLILFNTAYSPLQTTSTLVDMDNDGVADDPGWIYLGKNGSDYGMFGALDLSKYLSMTVTGMDTSSGDWALRLDPSIIAAVQEVLGPNAFDHLAFLMKAGNDFAVYDFDFSILGQKLPAGAIDYATAYTFSGTWSTNDFPNPNGRSTQKLSNLVFWARDPVLPRNNVPEPASLALLGLGLVGLVASRRRS